MVPYKGTAPAFQDLIGGQIDGFIDPILGSLQYHKSGMLRVVAVTSQHALAQPAGRADRGRDDSRLRVLQLVRPVGPGEAAGRHHAALNAEVNKALAGDMKDKLAQQGLLLTPGSVDDFVKFQAADMARAQKIITEGHIRVE